MALRRLLLRYFPPGIILEYVEGGESKTRSIDLLDLRPDTDFTALVEEIQKREPLITASCLEHVIHLVQRLQEKLGEKQNHKFSLFKVLRTHILPLTNVAFNKSGSRFITGSYDRTCKLWDTASGEELRSLEGHRNVVYAIAFNNPYGFWYSGPWYIFWRLHFSLALTADGHNTSTDFSGSRVQLLKFSDKIATGSFDKTCKLWSTETGQCYHTFRGHSAEIVCLSFNPQSTLLATGSMDTTAKLWDLEKGEEVATLNGHSAEIIALSFNTTGDRIITGSFDHTVAVWDVGTGRLLHTLIGHRGEISSAQFNWDCSLIVTGSMDKTCMLWDAETGTHIATLAGHSKEVLDVCFDYAGQRIATASADGSARVYNAGTKQCIAKLEGHEDEISKVCFNPKGNCILTASCDKTARLWDAATGHCLQILEGHADEIFSCAFNYKGDTIITGSKDNSCRIWH